MTNFPANKKIIGFDLDGTLAESKQKLTYGMAELLLGLLKVAKVAIISGGAFPQFDAQLLSSLREVAHIIRFGADGTLADAASASPLISPDALPELRNLTLLPTNGSQRYDYDLATAEWKHAHLVHFPDELRSKVISAFDDILKSADYALPSETSGPALEDRGSQITYSALGQNAPLDKKKAWDPDQAKRQKIKAYLETMLPEADISIGGTTSIDILPKGINKAAGLGALLATLGLEKDEMAYVGDALFPGGNDYSVSEYGIECFKVANPRETAVLIKSWLG